MRVKILISFIAAILIGCLQQEANVVTFPTATPGPPPNNTPVPIASSTPVPPTAMASPVAMPTPTIVIPSLTPYPDDVVFSIGTSIEGRPLEVWQYGEGEIDIMLIGGMHGGYEGNSVVLTEQLVAHFRNNPLDILPGIRLLLMPVANPDGLTRGSTLQGRFNANGVDLNRNWGCEWSETAYLRDIEVDPGPRPFSEPESVALREYFVADPPDAVIFYHSALGAIFMGACNDAEAARWMGELLAEATGYRYEQEFGYYEVNGDASNWLAERGIPAAVIELETRTESEFDQNLPGVIALQCHYYEQIPTSNLMDPEYLRLCVDS